jgi:hypothetical protein
MHFLGGIIPYFLSDYTINYTPRGARHFCHIKGKYTVQLQHNILNDISVALIESGDDYGFVVYRKTPYLPIYRYKTSLFGAEPVVHREEGHHHQPQKN